jgi:hypothetical protein
MFDLTVEGLVLLKKSGVSDDSIVSMMTYQSEVEKSEKNSTASEASKTLVNAKASSARTVTKTEARQVEHIEVKPGIYYCIGSAPELVQLETSVFSTSKSGSGLATAYTRGIAKTKQKSILNGVASNFEIEEKSPVFRFYFGQGRDDFATTANFGWFSSATNPNEFILVRFDIKNGAREIVTGSFNYYEGNSIGVDKANKMEFKFQKLEDGVYKVFFDKPLPKGEYCFMYAGGTNASNVILNKVYDFSIK